MPKIKPKPSKIIKKITQDALERKLDYNEQFGRFAFSSCCDRHCLLSEWQKRELVELISFFKKVEKLNWKNILINDALNYESHNFTDLPPPSTLPPDASLDSMRVTQKMRVYGYRTQDVFNIIWFDREHKVCPMGKKCKYQVS